MQDDVEAGLRARPPPSFQHLPPEHTDPVKHPWGAAFTLFEFFVFCVKMLVPAAFMAVLLACVSIWNKADPAIGQRCQNMNGTCASFFYSDKLQWQAADFTNPLCPVSMTCTLNYRPHSPGDEKVLLVPPLSMAIELGRSIVTTTAALRNCSKVAHAVVPPGAGWISLQSLVGTMLGVLINLLYHKILSCCSKGKEREENYESINETRETRMHERLFRVTPLLGAKAILLMLLGYFEALYFAMNADSVENAWERYNVFAALVLNSLVVKACVDISTMNLLENYDKIDQLDSVLATRSDGYGNVTPMKSTFLICFNIVASPFISIGIGLQFLKILCSESGALNRDFTLHDGFEIWPGSSLNRTYPKPAMVFFSLYTLMVAPVLVTHFVPGFIVFLPWMLAFAASVAPCFFVLMAVMTFVTLRWLVRIIPKPGWEASMPFDNELSTYYWTLREVKPVPTSKNRWLALFHCIRLAIGVVAANIIGTYLWALPGNMMIATYLKSPPLVGRAYIDTLFNDWFTRSESCYALQWFSDAMSSLMTVLRFF